MDELSRLFGQQVLNKLAESAIADLRDTGKSFDELFRRMCPIAKISTNSGNGSKMLFG
jgi:hypothetical protein